MFRNKYVAGVVAAAGLLMASSSVQAMDIAKVKAKDTPELGSVQGVQVCAASFSASAYLATKGSDDAELYLKLAKAWVSMAAEMGKVTYNDYVNNTLTGDMQSLYDSGTDVVQFYHIYCLKATQEILAKDDKK